jgi:hypothetical protein
VIAGSNAGRLFLALNDKTPLSPGLVPGNCRQKFNDTRFPDSFEISFNALFLLGEAGAAVGPAAPVMQ